MYPSGSQGVMMLVGSIGQHQGVREQGSVLWALVQHTREESYNIIEGGWLPLWNPLGKGVN